MEKELYNQLQRHFQKPKPRLYAGQRHGRPVFMLKHKVSTEDVRKKYGIETKGMFSLFVDTLTRTSYRDAPFFSDTLDRIFRLGRFEKRHRRKKRR